MSIDVSKIKAGDWVSVTVGYEDQSAPCATLSGTVYCDDADTLRLGLDCLRNFDGSLGLAFRSIDEHKPARKVGDLKISPDGMPAVYVGNRYQEDERLWALPHPTAGHSVYLSDDEVAGWADAEVVKK